MIGLAETNAKWNDDIAEEIEAACQYIADVKERPIANGCIEVKITIVNNMDEQKDQDVIWKWMQKQKNNT